MVLQQGLPLLYQQFTALFKKNLLLSWRNMRSTCLQLFSSFFFILVIFCIEEAMKASEASSSAYKNVTDPTLLFSPPILPCEDKFFVKLPCYDFLWSGNDSRRVTDIVSAIMANNPGRPIPTNKVRFLLCLVIFSFNLIKVLKCFSCVCVFLRFNHSKHLRRSMHGLCHILCKSQELCILWK